MLEEEKGGEGDGEEGKKSKNQNLIKNIIKPNISLSNKNNERPVGVTMKMMKIYCTN